MDTIKHRLYISIEVIHLLLPLALSGAVPCKWTKIVFNQIKFLINLAKENGDEVTCSICL